MKGRQWVSDNLEAMRGQKKSLKDWRLRKVME